MREELKKFIEEYGPERFFYEEYETQDFADGKYNIDFIEQHGGEGEGDQYHVVLKFTDSETGEFEYVLFDGWYASYVGSEYSDWRYVVPVERMVTFYE